MSQTEKDKIIAELIIGDLDKPFDLPECECCRCENWRRSVGRETNESKNQRLKGIID